MMGAVGCFLIGEFCVHSFLVALSSSMYVARCVAQGETASSGTRASSSRLFGAASGLAARSFARRFVRRPVPHLACAAPARRRQAVQRARMHQVCARRIRQVQSPRWRMEMQRAGLH